MSKILVIGANHAGTAAINTILGNYPGNEVIVLERNNNTSFLGCGTALWLGKQIDGSEGLFYSSPKALQDAGAKVSINTEVNKIDFDNKTVYYTNENGEGTETYDKLILATGSIPIKPNVAGFDLENVQFVKLFQEAQAIENRIDNENIKHCTVVGAGYIGVEIAEAFIRRGKKVTLIDSAPTCLATYYDPEFTKLMEDNLIEHGIDVKFGQTVKEFKGSNKVEKVVTDKEEFDTDMVIMCIGFTPNSALGKDKLETFKNGAYLVDKHQRTSDPDVYAIGDCATVYDNAIDSVDYIALATNAVRSGIVAAHNICGTDLEGIGVQGSNGINIWDLKMVSTGITENRAKLLGIDVSSTTFEDLQRPEFMKENASVKLKIVYEKSSRRIVGMQAASEYDMSMINHMFSLAIQEKITIDKLSLLDIFFLPHFNKPYNYITMAAITAK